MAKHLIAAGGRAPARKDGAQRARAAKATPTRHKHVPGASRIRAKELPTFTRGLAFMSETGLPLVETLHVLEEQADAGSFRRVISDLRHRVETGHPLSAGIACYPSVFDPSYVNMLRTGESTGKMAESLHRLADYIEQSQQLSQKVRSAMVYPIIVAAIAGVLTIAMLTWIVPAFAQIYSDLGAPLPRPTQVLVHISDAFRNDAPFLIGVSALLILGLRIYFTSPPGALVWDRLSLKWPVFGELNRKIAMTRLCEALSQMLQAGVPMLQALQLAGEAASNRAIENCVESCRHSIEQGQTLSAAIGRYTYFPPLLLRMVVVGEKTGALDVTLSRTAAFYRRDVEHFLNGLTAAIEPLLIVTIGLIVGSVVVCMFIPIFTMNEVIAF